MNGNLDKSKVWGSSKKIRTEKQSKFSDSYEARKRKPPKQVKTINIDAVNAEQLEVFSELNKISQSNIINVALAEYFEKHTLSKNNQ